MNLFVNGQATSCAGVKTVSELLAHLHVRGNFAVEINREIVARSKFEHHLLADGDKIEIVTAIGGG